MAMALSQNPPGIIVHSFFEAKVPIEENLAQVKEVEAEVLADPEERRPKPLNPKPPLKSNRPNKAARLPHFSQAWHRVTSNNFILNIVCNGYKCEKKAIKECTQCKGVNNSSKQCQKEVEATQVYL